MSKKREAEVGFQDADSGARARDLGAHRAAAEWVHIDDLAAWERNPKKRTEADIREAMGSLRRFGFCAPMVAWGSRKMLVAGHARMAALRRILKQDPTLDGKGGANVDLAEKNKRLRESLGGPSAWHAPVRLREFSSMAEAEAYALRDNNDFGENDEQALSAILKDLSEGGTEIDGLGFSETEMAELFGEDAGGAGKVGGDDTSKLNTEWLVVVECADEAHQLETIETLQRDGYTVRALV